MTRRARLSLLAGAVLVSLAVLVGLAALGGTDGDGERRLAPGRGATETTTDPLAYRPDRREDLETRAAAGVAHVLYAKSPGGATATAARVARWRPMVERAAGDVVDPDVLEAMVFLESAGRPDARASDDLEGAVGLTQILAETGQNLLGMRVDVRASERLTRGIARGRRVAAREAARRRVDERFDPAKALAGAVRYLEFAKGELDGREDLAVASYHMGVGNLQQALSRYGEDDIPYAQLYFDSTPLRHAAAWRKLASLGDDSSTYLWRVKAAQRIMATWRHEPAEVDARAAAMLAKASREEVLHPRLSTPQFADPQAVEDAVGDGALEPLDPDVLGEDGLRIDRRMGELARRIGQPASRYRALRPEALALLRVLGRAVAEAADGGRLVVTSSVRDLRYQRLLLRAGNREATRGYSLHTTGWSFDVARDYRDRRQALAFQFWLDRLQALDLIAWVREPGAIHVTVSRRARALIAPVASAG